MLYNLTDMFWVGRLGSNEVAATGATGMYIWLSVAFMLFGSLGASIGVSQSIGRGDLGKAESFARTALALALAFGLVCGLVMFVFKSPMVAFFAFKEEDVSEHARRYLAIVAASVPFSYVSASLASVFNASGRSKVPLACSLVGTGLNVILDPIFIIVLGLGVSGAAIATVIGNAVGAALLLFCLKRSKSRPFENFKIFKKLDFKDVRQILKWAAPVCLESFLFTSLAMITSRREASFGADAMAVSRVGSQIESLTWLVGASFGTALTAFAGQNYGAGKWDRIHKAFKISSVGMAAYGLFVSSVLVFAGRFLFTLFLPDSGLEDLSSKYLSIIAICQVPVCMEATASSMFRGLGRTLPPSIVNTTCNIIRVPLCYLLSMTSLGLVGVWAGISFAACLKGAWSYPWFFLSRKRLQRENPFGLKAPDPEPVSV
jgi:putative MATE family efflux protein